MGEVTVEERTIGYGAGVVVIRSGFEVLDLTRWEVVRLVDLLAEMIELRGWR